MADLACRPPSARDVQMAEAVFREPGDFKMLHQQQFTTEDGQKMVLTVRGETAPGKMGMKSLGVKVLVFKFERENGAESEGDTLLLVHNKMNGGKQIYLNSCVRRAGPVTLTSKAKLVGGFVYSAEYGGAKLFKS